MQSELIGVLAKAAINGASEHIPKETHYYLRASLIMTIVFIVLYLIPLNGDLMFLVRVGLFFMSAILILHFC